jgi:hypothetical protein
MSSICNDLDAFFSTRTTYGVLGFPGYCGRQPTNAARFNLFCTIPSINSSVSNRCDELLTLAEDDPNLVMHKLLEMSDTQPQMIRDAGWTVVNRAPERKQTLSYISENFRDPIQVTGSGLIVMAAANPQPAGKADSPNTKDQLYWFNNSTQTRVENLINDTPGVFRGYSIGPVYGEDVSNGHEYVLFSTVGAINEPMYLIDASDIANNTKFLVANSNCNIGEPGGANMQNWTAFSASTITASNTSIVYGIARAPDLSTYHLKVMELNVTTKSMTLLQLHVLSTFSSEGVNTRLDITPDGAKCLLVGSFAPTKVYNLADNSFTTLGAPTPFISNISDDGRFVVGAVSSFVENKCLYIWDLTTGVTTPTPTWINIGDLSTETPTALIQSNVDASRILLQTTDSVDSNRYWYIIYNRQQVQRYSSSQFISSPNGQLFSNIISIDEETIIATVNSPLEIIYLTLGQLDEYINDTSKPDRVSVLCDNGDVVTFDSGTSGAHNSTNTSDGTAITSVLLAEQEYTVFDPDNDEFVLPPNGRYILQRTGQSWQLFINVFNNQFTGDWANKNSTRFSETQKRYTNSYCDKMVNGANTFADERCTCVNPEKLLRTLVSPDTEQQQPSLWRDLLNVSRCMSAYCRGLTEDKKEDTFMAFLMEAVFLPPCPNQLVICSSALVIDQGTVEGNVSVNQNCGNGNTVQSCGECQIGTKCVEGLDGVKKCFLLCGSDTDCPDGSSCSADGVCLPPPTDDTDSASGNGLTTPELVGIIVGSIVGVALIGVAIWAIIKFAVPAATTSTAAVPVTKR